VLKLEVGHEVVIEEGRKVRFGFEVEYVLELEHSLTSLSKWEEIWEKPFLVKESHSVEEILSYIVCMVMTPDPPLGFELQLTEAQYIAVDKYINAKMTATWFNEREEPKKASTEKITYELIEYWLSNLPSVPPDYKTWHLNKLFTFIRIHDVKSQKPTKASGAKAAADRRALNEQRRAMYNSRG
jgi:hypothetical protein